MRTFQNERSQNERDRVEDQADDDEIIVPDEGGVDVEEDADSKLRIYFLPNLMTAGNLICGFVALTKIVEADINSQTFNTVIHHALLFILAACVFDLLDGRLARMGGHESPFGREFDSLADLISFGIAPAFLMHRIVLKDVTWPTPEAGWMIAAAYLVCGAFRLARFNCLAIIEEQEKKPGGSKDFLGFPIPAAAGLVVSLTLFILWTEEKGFTAGKWRYALPVILLFLSFMMVSEVKYPSFKKLDLRARSRFAKMVGTVLFLAMLVLLWDKILPLVLPAILTTYLVYGFIRPHISRKMRREIEEDDDDDEERLSIS